MRKHILEAACLLAVSLAGAPLPLGKVPPGKVFLVILPHHDDHTWEYGFAGLITKFVDAGYTGYYVRVTNDEKDGSLGWPGNNIVNHRETIEAVRYLGMQEVLSLNWRNDHSDSVPLNEMRAQLILLIRKYRPQAVMAYHPWGHYDRNPDHRKTARAVAEATWAAGNPNFLPEHFKLGLQPFRVPYRYFSQRSDYGKGYEPNIAFELNESQMERKSKAYWMNRNVRLQPSMARSIRARLDQQKLTIPALQGLDDIEATKKLQEWAMYWISEKRGQENGVKYAEVFDFMDEFDDLPALKPYLLDIPATPRPPVPVSPVSAGGVILAITAHADDYLLSAGGTLAAMTDKGATVHLVQVTNDEKEGGSDAETAQSARALGVKEVVRLGYRSGELADVPPNELRDRIAFLIRHYKPRALFLPDPYIHHDDKLDHYYTGTAAEEARFAAALTNFQPPFALAGLETHRVPELYYYALPLDARWLEPESTATFVPQPLAVDIAATFDRKLRAVRALRGNDRALAQDIRNRLVRGGRRLKFLDTVNDASVDRLVEIRLRGLGMTERFLHAGRENGVVF